MDLIDEADHQMQTRAAIKVDAGLEKPLVRLAEIHAALLVGFIVFAAMTSISIGFL